MSPQIYLGKEWQGCKSQCIHLPRNMIKLNLSHFHLYADTKQWQSSCTSQGDCMAVCEGFWRRIRISGKECQRWLRARVYLRIYIGLGQSKDQHAFCRNLQQFCSSWLYLGVLPDWIWSIYFKMQWSRSFVLLFFHNRPSPHTLHFDLIQAIQQEISYSTIPGNGAISKATKMNKRMKQSWVTGPCLMLRWNEKQGRVENKVGILGSQYLSKKPSKGRSLWCSNYKFQTLKEKCLT